MLHPSRNCEYGLFKECIWFLEASKNVSEGLLRRRGGSFFTYLGEMLDGPAVLPEILGAGIAEEPCRTGTFVWTEVRVFNPFYKVTERFQWTWSVWKVSALETPSKRSEVSQCHRTCQGPRCHSFES